MRAAGRAWSGGAWKGAGHVHSLRKLVGAVEAHVRVDAVVGEVASGNDALGATTMVASQDDDGRHERLASLRHRRR